MSKIRFNLAIVLFHALLLLPILLRFFFILFHWYTPAQDGFFCALEFVCMAAGSLIVLILPRGDIPFIWLLLPMFLSALFYMALAVFLNLGSVELFAAQGGHLTEKVSGEPTPLIVYGFIPQWIYYPVVAAGFAVAGGLCAAVAAFLPKLRRLRNKLFWLSICFWVLFLPAGFVNLAAGLAVAVATRPPYYY